MTERDVDEIVDKAIFEKKNVKDILVEMKDTSELMVDLAYSALLTNSKNIAEEVRKLEGNMDDLQYEIETLLLLSARDREEAADLSGILHVAYSAENIADSAEDIVDVVLRGAGDHPIYQNVLGESEEQVDRIKVEKNSPVIGKTLGELEVSTKTGCYVRAIRKKNDWIYTPNRETKLEKGDVLILNGSKSAIETLEKIVSGEEKI